MRVNNIKIDLDILDMVRNVYEDNQTTDRLIDNDSLKGDIRLPVTLQQTVWVEYKRKCLFWKKVKAIHPTISSDSPYVDIKYSNR